jgi:hypothetical protein
LQLAAAAAVVVTVASGCASGPVTRTAVGPVAEVFSHSLCLDEGHVVATCYSADPALLGGVRPGYCVHVEADVVFGRAPTLTLTAIEHVSAAAHTAACSPS